jgi:predicted metal-dependent hydrolase
MQALRLPFFGPRKAAATARPVRGPYTLEVGDLGATVQRKPMRTLRLRLKPPDGALLVSAPLRIADRDISSFIASRRDWILAQREPGYLDGESLPLLDRRLTLRVVEGGKTCVARRLDDATVLLKAPPQCPKARREAALWRWYGRELLAEAQARLPGRQSAMGVQARGVRVRAMRSRWGSCNIREGVVTLALELARRPSESLDYVIVHELAHLIVRSHGKRFKSILDKNLPDWRRRRKTLNERPLG